MPQDLERLLREAHRRSLWQVSAGYLVAGWLVYEASVSLTEGLGLPSWVPPVALLLVVAGLPIVLATAIVQRGGPWSSGSTAAEETRLEGLEPVAAEIGSGRTAPRPPAPSDVPSEGHAGPRARRFFTWNRAITGGVLAFAGLGLASTGVLGMRAMCVGPVAPLSCEGALGEEAILLLADFRNPGADSDLGDVVTEALRVDLLGSERVRLADAAEVREGMARMRVEEGERLAGEDARQLALREGYPAVLTGEVSALGEGYVLTARVVSASDGTELAGFRVTAAGPDELIGAVDELSERIRGRIGESLRSARAGEPLERTTTASLEALRLYTQAVRKVDAGGSRNEAIRLLEEAVQADTAFATAWRKLGVERNNQGLDQAGAEHALEQALAFSERLPERERYLVRGSYYASTGEDDDRAIAAYEQAVERFQDPVALNNLSILYNRRGEGERAEATLRQAMAQEVSPSNYVNLVQALWLQRRDDAALATTDSAVAAFPNDAPLGTGAVFVRIRTRRWAAADSMRAALDSILAADMEWLLNLEPNGVFLDLMRGRTRDAEEGLEQLGAAAGAVGLPGLQANVAMGSAVTRVLRGDTAGARAVLEAGRAAHPLEGVAPAQRPWGTLVGLYVAVGQPDRARQALAAWRADTAATQPSPAERAGIDAELALAEGELATVERLLPEVEPECLLCALRLEGDMALAAGDTARARRAYAAYDTARPARGDVHFHWAMHLARILETSARLAEAGGDTAAAADYYARFVNQWEEADPELQPRVEAARRRLQVLVGSGG